MTKPDRMTAKAIFASVYSGIFSPFTMFIWLAGWIVAVIAGPFGTYSALDVPFRIAYWGLIATGGVVLGYGVYATSLVLLKSERHRLFAIVASVLMTALFAPMVIGLRSLFAMYSNGMEVHPMPITINTFVVVAAVFLFRQLLLPAASNPETELFLAAAQDEPSTDTSAARLNRRLPEHLRGEILRLSANDHRVEVVTDKGTVELRMRFVDAIDEMDPVAGLCVHRSHWVTLNAIDRVERLNAHKTCVHLKNGDEIPVSRKYRVNLEKAGLIDKPRAA